MVEPGQEQQGAPEDTSVPIRVVRASTGERVPHSVVSFRRGDEVLAWVTDDDGDLPDPIEIGHGTWQVSALHDGYRPQKPVGLPIPIPEGRLKDGRLVFELVHLTSDMDEKLGRTFFIGLWVMLALLIVGYVQARQPSQGDTATGRALLLDSVALKAQLGSNPDQKVYGEAVPRVERLRKSLDDVQASGQLREDLEQASVAVEALERDLGEWIESKPPAEAPKTLSADLDQIVVRVSSVVSQMPTTGQTLSLWRTGRSRYLDVAFWAVAGILVRLLFTVGIYLRWNRFYRRGMYLHMTLLIAAPLLTIVFVLLISMIKVGGDAIQVDFSDPRILVGVSFLLAATPWRLWERLQAVAGKVIGEESARKARKSGEGDDSSPAA